MREEGTKIRKEKKYRDWDHGSIQRRRRLMETGEMSV
jgi:hypothetical protein